MLSPWVQFSLLCWVVMAVSVCRQGGGTSRSVPRALFRPLATQLWCSCHVVPFLLTSWVGCGHHFPHSCLATLAFLAVGDVRAPLGCKCPSAIGSQLGTPAGCSVCKRISFFLALGNFLVGPSAPWPGSALALQFWLSLNGLAMSGFCSRSICRPLPSGPSGSGP